MRQDDTDPLSHQVLWLRQEKKGAVRVFGRDLYQYTNEELADTLCYVPQTTYLFAGSIRDNLVYGLSDHFSKGSWSGLSKRRVSTVTWRAT